MLRIGFVAENNLDGSMVNAKGEPYPLHYVTIRKPWMATPNNPDPVTPHPIPVFINRQHQDGNQFWEPLPVNTRVLVAEVERTPINREGLAVIAFGPQTDEPFGDTRETVNYANRNGGNVDKVVLADSDPVEGPNADYGREHRDGEGSGWHTLRPFPDDATRREMHAGVEGVTEKFEHRLDKSKVEYVLTVTGPKATYTFKFDGVAGTATVEDNKGQSIEIDSDALSVSVVAVGDVSVQAGGNILLGADADGPAVARVGDTVTVGANTGTITSGSSKVFSG